jgi:hypothetical protein
MPTCHRSTNVRPLRQEETYPDKHNWPAWGQQEVP